MNEKDDVVFSAILPDNPFRVIHDKASHGGGEKNFRGAEGLTRYMPILQFRTCRTELHVAMRVSGAVNAAKPANTGICRCDIIDKAGDWCGAVVLDDAWIRARQRHVF